MSRQAGYDRGAAITQPFRYNSNEAKLNCSTSAAGCIRVEIQDLEDRRYRGFFLIAAPEQYGDEIDGIYHWPHKLSPGTITGIRVQLQIVLKNAKLSTFRFRAYDNLKLILSLQYSDTSTLLATLNCRKLRKRRNVTLILHRTSYPPGLA